MSAFWHLMANFCFLHSWKKKLLTYFSKRCEAFLFIHICTLAIPQRDLEALLWNLLSFIKSARPLQWLSLVRVWCLFVSKRCQAMLFGLLLKTNHQNLSKVRHPVWTAWNHSLSHVFNIYQVNCDELLLTVTWYISRICTLVYYNI